MFGWKTKDIRKDEHPTIVGQVEMLRILSCCMTPGYLLDKNYYCPTNAWLKAFFSYHAEELRRIGVECGSETFDCDNHAIKLFSDAQTFYHLHPQKGADAVAIGIIVYAPKNTPERHMVCYCVKSGYILSFIEAVPDGDSEAIEAVLTKGEKDSVDLVLG